MYINLKSVLSKITLLVLFLLFLTALSEREVFYTIITIIIIFSFEFFTKKNAINDIFYPKYILLVFFYLYSLAGISAIEVIGTDSQGTVIPLKILDDYIVSCLIGLFGLCLGFSLFKTKNSKKEYIKNFNDKKAYKILSFYVLFALVFNFKKIFDKYNFLSVQSYAETALSYRLEFQESTGSGLFQVFLLDSPVLLINFFFIYNFFKSKNKIIKILYLLPYISCLLTAVLSGFRGHLIAILLPFLFFYHYQVKRYKLTPIKVLISVFSGFFGYTAINLLALLRSTSDIKEMSKIIYELYVNRSFVFNSIANSGELTTSINLMRLMLGIERGEVNYTYGLSFINEILVFIPLAFFPNRPKSVSEEYVVSFHPEIYDIGGGLGQFCLLEGYWAFGNIGVLLTSVAFTYLIAKFYSKILPYLAISSIFVLLYSQVFNSVVISVIRGGYIGAIKASLIGSIVIILAIKISKNFKY
jgi:oligosaccharide repeat unit polymerase